MARKSKYEKQSNKLSTPLWKPALYIRLSREDGDREESNSIASQRELLTEFTNAQTDMTVPVCIPMTATPARISTGRTFSACSMTCAQASSTA